MGENNTTAAGLTKHGVYGNAAGTGGPTNIGIYGTATGATTNWAGYFNAGDVYIQNNVGIGTTTPGMISGSTQYVTIGNTGAYAPGSATSLEMKGNTNSANAVAAKLDFLNGLGTNNIARIEVRTSGGSTAEGRLLFYTRAGATVTEKMRIMETGNVGIGTTTPNGLLELGLDQGRKPGTTTWTVVSDERLKNIGGTYTKGLTEILQLQPVTYYYKNVGERKFNEEVLKTQNVGFSAQEVQKVFPEAVGTDEDGYLNFNMHAILVAYVNAIKEQQAQIEELKKQLEEQNKKIQKIIDEKK